LSAGATARAAASAWRLAACSLPVGLRLRPRFPYAWCRAGGLLLQPRPRTSSPVLVGAPPAAAGCSSLGPTIAEPASTERSDGIVEIGRKLVEVKERVGHGKYTAFVTERLGWSVMQATRFVNVYELTRKPNKLLDFDGLTIDASSLYLIAAPSTTEEARQAVLEKADRIQGRAIQRCGELIEQIPPAKPGPKLDRGTPTELEPDRAAPTRFDAAREAGLSRDQAVTAIRVARVPKPEFEATVESDNPPTVTQQLALGSRRPARGRLSPGARLPPRARQAVAHRRIELRPARQSVECGAAVQGLALDRRRDAVLKPQQVGDDAIAQRPHRQHRPRRGAARAPHQHPIGGAIVVQRAADFAQTPVVDDQRVVAIQVSEQVKLARVQNRFHDAVPLSRSGMMIGSALLSPSSWETVAVSSSAGGGSPHEGSQIPRLKAFIWHLAISASSAAWSGSAKRVRRRQSGEPSLARVINGFLFTGFSLGGELTATPSGELTATVAVTAPPGGGELTATPSGSSRTV
jgi:hypothetical protein